MLKLKDYRKVAEQAKSWSMDDSLSPANRGLASNLLYLAEMLSDASFGCPAEDISARVWFCHLCRAVSATTATADPTCPDFADCSWIAEMGDSDHTDPSQIDGLAGLPTGGGQTTLAPDEDQLLRINRTE